MNRTKLPIRERIGNVPQFPVGVDAVVAEELESQVNNSLKSFKVMYPPGNQGRRPHGLIQTTSEEPSPEGEGTWVCLTGLLGICEIYITVCKGEHNRSAVPTYE
ncbi:hypothetical protein AgCh_000667 [Apium graveolens]